MEENFAIDETDRKRKWSMEYGMTNEVMFV